MNEEEEKIKDFGLFYTVGIKGIKKKLKLLAETLITSSYNESYCYNSEFKSIHLTTIESIIESLQKLKGYIEKGEYESFNLEAYR